MRESLNLIEDRPNTIKDKLGLVERRIIGAMLALADKNNVVNANQREIARTIKYKSSGGSITLGIKVLTLCGYVERKGDSTYKLTSKSLQLQI